jgi:outer membrane protein TolC
MMEAEPLTLEAALEQALARNRNLAVQVYGPEISAQGIDEARAAFDPNLSVTASYAEQNTPRVVSPVTTGSAASGIAPSASTLQQAVDTARFFLSESATIAAAVAGDSLETTTTRSTAATARLGQTLPTGAEIYVTGTYGRDQSSIADDAFQGTWNIGLSQPLLRGAGTPVNLVALRQARNDAAMGGLALRDFVLSLVAQVDAAYWDLALAQETYDIQVFSLDLAREQLGLNQALITVGKLAGSAIVSAEAELAAQQAALVDAEAALRTRTLTLWQLLNPEDTAPENLRYTPITIPEPDLPALDGSTSVRLAEAFRPDIAQARLDVANAELAVVQTRNGLLPQLDAFVSYGTLSRGSQAGSWNTYLDDTTFDQFEVGVTFSMTLGNRAERARHRRATYQEDQARAAVTNLEQLVEAEVRQGVVEVIRQHENIGASEQEVLAREEELRIERDQFRLGRSTNLDVLQVQRQFIEAKVRLATARVGYLQALTALHRSEGTLLTRRAIVVPETQEYI